MALRRHFIDGKAPYKMAMRDDIRGGLQVDLSEVICRAWSRVMVRYVGMKTGPFNALNDVISIGTVY